MGLSVLRGYFSRKVRFLRRDETRAVPKTRQVSWSCVGYESSCSRSRPTRTLILYQSLRRLASDVPAPKKSWATAPCVQNRGSLASGSRSQGAQTVVLAHRELTSLAHLLSLAQVWLTHNSGYSSNSLGPKTEMENAHVEIPISNYLFRHLNSKPLAPAFHAKPVAHNTQGTQSDACQTWISIAKG